MHLKQFTVINLKTLGKGYARDTDRHASSLLTIFGSARLEHCLLFEACRITFAYFFQFSMFGGMQSY